MPDDSKAETSASSNSDNASDAPAPEKKRRVRPVFVVAALVFVAGVYFGITEVHKRLTFIFEEDARIHADLITVSSRVAGWITEMTIIEGDNVQAGSVLLQVDDRESQIILNELEAELEGIKAERDRVTAERELVSSQVESRLLSEQARVASAGVAVSSLRPQRELAERELARAKKLFDDKVSSRRQLDLAETQHQQIDREYRLAVADLSAAKARIAEVEADRARLEVLAADLRVIEQRLAQTTARVERQRLDIVDRAIKSPIAGVVDRTFVDSGEYITPGQRLALIHNPENVWVEANIKETQVAKLVIGQPVDIHVDAYPDQSFKGRVQTIGNAATSQFALLPTPNPSGNFTKITQRLPVRISFDAPNAQLRPGMMVEVKIAITAE